MIFTLMDKIEKAVATKQEVTLIDKMGKYLRGKMEDSWVHLSGGKLKGKIVFVSVDKGERQIDVNDILDIVI